jgi:hypothetical protein
MTPQRADSFSRWIVTIVASGLIGLLGFLAVRDRVSIDASLVRLQTILESQSAILAKHEVELQLLKNNLQNLNEQTRENGGKLDNVLIEVKKAKR